MRGRSDDRFVYLFPYDWRYSNVVSAQRLVWFVKQLQNKPIKNWDRRFDFVVHSMGGLVLRAFLNEWSASGEGPLPIGRVVFIATPHLGSLDAVEGLISGEAVLFGQRKEIRKLLRTFPSVYELLPRFDHAVVRDDADVNVFDEKNWQENVTDTVQSRDDDYGVVQTHLTNARSVLTALPQPTEVLPSSNWLVIYGNKPNSTTARDPRRDGARGPCDCRAEEGLRSIRRTKGRLLGPLQRHDDPGERIHRVRCRRAPLRWSTSIFPPGF